MQPSQSPPNGRRPSEIAPSTIVKSEPSAAQMQPPTRTQDNVDADQPGPAEDNGHATRKRSSKHKHKSAPGKAAVEGTTSLHKQGASISSTIPKNTEALLACEEQKDISASAAEIATSFDDAATRISQEFKQGLGTISEDLRTLKDRQVKIEEETQALVKGAVSEELVHQTRKIIGLLQNPDDGVVPGLNDVARQMREVVELLHDLDDRTGPGLNEVARLIRKIVQLLQNSDARVAPEGQEDDYLRGLRDAMITQADKLAEYYRMLDLGSGRKKKGN